ncbi:hypothetical protein BDZ90DRAFT_61565 [Jaminaea rosea]|uniref:DUF3835 domain-containing protein n=1 Tax=Jaminaea rosea TaxID=1569628 RepID=A0A316UKJ5_9BASI|nr:hypothetical protein BDZ90DRAFT_61565 [Jaminaea rosea]PWN25750.1 hypothetical protein BDZ90DRAFT_61565 [Jaminaea rosea]
MATPHLNPSSDLVQLLSSLGLSTEQDNGQAAAQPLGPDPLVVARGRLTKLKADIDALAPLVKGLVDDQVSPDCQIALRLDPPVTSSSHSESPPFLRLSPGQTWQSIAATAAAAAAMPSPRPASYMPFETTAQAVSYLQNLLARLTQHFESLRSTLVAEAQERIKQTLAAASKDPAAALMGASSDRQIVDEDGRILNEEGLPFVDPMETIQETPSSTISAQSQLAAVEAFKPQNALEGEDRKKWIDSVFSRFEGMTEDQEDEEGEARETASEQTAAPHQEAQRTRSPTPKPSQSKPLKSVLKASPVPPLTTSSKFGHQGIRRGFLNMNPSSPAAASSSDPLDKRFDEGSPTPMPRSMSQSEGSAREDEANVEAMTRSMQGLDNYGAPAAHAAKSKKKSVRIQSPERGRKRGAKEEEAAPASASLKAFSAAPADPATAAADPDAGVEDEAARIVDLLGPEIVSGTDRGEDALRGLREEQTQAEEMARKQVQQIQRKRQQQEENKAKGPAVGLSVLERPREAAASTSDSSSTATALNAAKQAAFKRGFLNRPPPSSKTAAANMPSPRPPVATGPRQSLGMSALDRSLISDGPLEAERELQGLPSAVPHARPSKAYREKLERSSQGLKAQEGRGHGGARTRTGLDGQVVVGTGKEGSGGDENAEGKGVRFQLDSSAMEEDDDGDKQEEDDFAELLEGDTAELELDEHDEEAYARSAYASGDLIDEDGADDEADEDGAHDSDWSLDSYEHYSASDLADLEPTFSGLVSDLENAELAREYALAQAKQMAERQEMSEERRKELAMAISGERMREEERMARGDDGGELWREDEIDGRDLVSSMGFEDEEIKKQRSVDPPNRMSRFKASRIVQALGMGADGVANQTDSNRPSAGFRDRGTERDRRADEAGHELAHLLEGATNAGPEPSAGPSSTSNRQPKEGAPSPVMILPSLTPLRYPRSATSSSTPARSSHLREGDRLPREGVDLEGETDEDEKDDELMNVMRVRLEEKQHREEQRANAATADPSDQAAKRNPPRPPPLRSRWNGIDEDDRPNRSGVAMAAPPSIGGRSGSSLAKKRELPVSSGGSGTDLEPQAPPSLMPAAPAAPQNAASAPKMSRFKAARMAAAAADQ